MTQMDLLVTSVAELLSTAVHEVLRLMGQAVSEYREESTRLHQENQRLQRRLDDLQHKLPTSDALQQVSSSGAVEEAAPFGPAAGCALDRQLSGPEEHERRGSYDLPFKEEKPSVPVEAELQDEPPSTPTHGGDTGEDMATRGRDSGEDMATRGRVSGEAMATRGILTNVKTESISDPSGQNQNLHIYDPHHTDPLNPAAVPLPLRREGSHPCPVCTKSFPTPSGLSAHAVCHSGRRPYACPLCRFSFSRVADLKKHERIHTGERPYNCALCGRSFNRAENLRRHLRKVHQHGAGGSPALCPYKRHQHVA